MGKVYGYGRVSKRTQKDDRQILQLKTRCDEVIIEQISADSEQRPKFEALLGRLKPDDTLLVLDLDRAFRNMVDAILVLNDLQNREVKFEILNSTLDLTTRMGRLMYVIQAHFAEEEVATIRRRTREGIAAARKRGVRIGRPYALTNAQIRRAHRCISKQNERTYKVAKRLKVSPTTLTKSIERLGLVAPKNIN